MTGDLGQRHVGHRQIEVGQGGSGDERDEHERGTGRDLAGGGHTGLDGGSGRPGEAPTPDGSPMRP